MLAYPDCAIDFNKTHFYQPYQFHGDITFNGARPQVADGGTASNMEGGYEYIEWAVADSR